MALTLGVRDLSGRDLTGQAVVVALTHDSNRPGRGRTPDIVHRSDLDLVGPDRPARVYHVAQGRPVAEAEKLVDATSAEARRRARDELGSMLDRLSNTGPDIAAIAVPGGDSGDDTLLADVLASHARIHTAEEQLYREAIIAAADELGLTVVGYDVRAISELTSELTGLPAATLSERVAAWGREVGPPWRKAHQEAALAAWFAAR